ncbi:ABC transporter permease [Oceanibacterium hippocampi]|uniref:Putative D,D-dipeptide transport system permease protein DdpC n=1 Tax=Oceanibacterium hippocampi TaxID=745714 RepID=A0A1Y5RTV6_9PROT|nr:ABC transporter permease [Oceanibacterium hippocampi]SLN24171.1 putative D,D-dipeptide transport system permease protein DdpC [Oceanibacterium hippocampi]
MTQKPSFLSLLLRNKAAAMGLVVLAVVLLTAIIGPFLYQVDPWAITGQTLLWPGVDPAHPLGTDVLGRDVLSGLISGARISLLIGVSATAASVMVGIVIGGLAGYFRGQVDNVLMRLTEIFQTIPSFIFVIMLVAVFHPSITVVVLSIATVSWPPVARLVRGEFLSLRQRPYVQSCIVVGMGELRIIFTQILPNAMAPIVVTASIMVASAILIEAGLAFLGLQDPNVMSWGAMIGFGRTVLRTAWYLSAIPGIVIFFTVLAISLVGEGLNDALNPRGTGQ